MRRFTDYAIEILLLLLLVGLPFALGAVEPWGYGAMELAVALLAFLYLTRVFVGGELHYFTTALNIMLVGFIVVPLVQLIPLPPQVTLLISPQRLATQEWVTLAQPSAPSLQLAFNPDLLQLELLKMIAYIAAFFITLNWLRDYNRAKRLFVYFALTGAALTLFALVQLAFWNGKIYWTIETQSAFPFGPYINHNHFAGFMELALGATLGLLLVKLQPLFSGKARLRDYSGAAPMLLGGLCALMVLGIFLSRSRGGVVSLVGASLITPFLVRRSQSRRVMFSTFVFIALLVAVALALGSGAVLGDYQFDKDPSARYRLITWRDTLSLVKDFWLIGVGLGNFAEAFPAYKTSFARFFTVHPENDYLQSLAEMGVIGLALFGGFTVIYYRRVAELLGKRRNEEVRGLIAGGMFGLVAFSLHGLYDFNFHIPANAFAFAVLAAVVLALVSLHVRSNGEMVLLAKVRSFTRRRSPLLFTPVLVLIFVCFFWYALVSSEGTYHSLKFISWFSTHRAEPPEQAIRINDPMIPGYEAEVLHWRARQLFDYGSQPGLVRLQQYAFFERGAELARQSVAMRPARGRYWALYAKCLAELGDSEQALKAFEAAVKFDPSNAEIHYDLVQYALFVRDRELAARELYTVRRLDRRLGLEQALEMLWPLTSDERVLRTVLVGPQEEQAFAAWYTEKTRANANETNR